MWKCPVCGTENIEDANFCKECGTKRGTVDEPTPHKPSSNPRKILIVVLGVVLAVTVVVTALSGGFSSLSFLLDGKGSAASSPDSIDSGAPVLSANSAGPVTTAPGTDSTVQASSGSSDQASVPIQTVTPTPSAPAQTVTPTPSAPAQTVTPTPSAPAQTVTPVPSAPDSSNGAGLNSTTEHRYEAFIEDVSWPEAFQRAMAKGGRLAIIRNENEWNKVYAALEQVNNPKVIYYIGAVRDSSTDSGPYYWAYDVEMNGSDSYKYQYFDDYDVTQETALSGHWLSGEPSYQDTVSVSGGGTVTVSECCLAILRPSDGTGWWVNDENDNLLNAYPSPYDFHGKIGYIVEYDQ